MINYIRAAKGEADGEKDPIISEVFRNLSFKSSRLHLGGRCRGELYNSYQTRTVEYTLIQTAKQKGKMLSQSGCAASSSQGQGKGRNKGSKVKTKDSENSKTIPQST
eukprot:scaffold224807_cov40-Prasinocladus_malaysianus.AAC.1